MPTPRDPDRRRISRVIDAALSVAVAAVALSAAVLSVGASAHAAVTPKCFGAAARDPDRPCENQRLRLTVTPTPDEATMIPNDDCVKERITDALAQCSFGVPAEQAVETVVVVGDSHAQQWRPALAVVARARLWRVLEVAIPHCLFSTALTGVGEPFTSWCPLWNHDVIEWLGAHPDLRTVFVSGNTLQSIVVAEGRSSFQTRVDGYVSRWKQLPPSVERVIVIRDTPQDRVATYDCLRRAMTHQQPPGPACAIRRRLALRTDPAAVAARLLGARNVSVADLTPQFCDRRVCFPVVGGVLVRRDGDHLTRLFARTLGPFLLRRINQIAI